MFHHVWIYGTGTKRILRAYFVLVQKLNSHTTFSKSVFHDFSYEIMCILKIYQMNYIFVFKNVPEKQKLYEGINDTVERYTPMY